MKQKQSIIDIARANKLGMRLELVIIIILTICYGLQGTKNSISIPGLVVILLTLWVPVIIARLIFSKTPDSELIKHVIGIGYGAFYLTVCIISDQQLVFAYVFPMLIIGAIYCNLKFSIGVGIVVCIISIAHGVMWTVKLGFTPQAIAAFEIQMAATVLIAVYSCLCNKFIITITGEHVDAINAATEKTETMLKGIMNVSNTLADEVSEVYEKMNLLEDSSQEMNTAMQEVSSGSTETAQSVENQLGKTEEIQSQIDLVTQVAKSIGDDLVLAVEACREGRNNIKELLSKSQVSQEAGIAVAEEVEGLKTATEKMESIVALISSVASQTSLLALNASIEAARAGEAGRGFAVVATEISNLASQTQSATGNIGELISNISSEITSVVESINSLVDNNRAQNESANITNGSFAKIDENIDNISQNSTKLTGVVKSLAGANQEIVESVQTISAVTEEVSAHANNTYSTTKRNLTVVSEVIDLVQKMNKNAEELAQMNA